MSRHLQASAFLAKVMIREYQRSAAHEACLSKGTLNMSQIWIRILFLVSAVYDFVLGAAFLVSGPQLFEQFGVPVPDHWGYIHFCCLMLMIFGLMFLAVAVRPQANRNLIPFGILLKFAYVGATGYYWLNGGIPWVFKPFLFIDAAMLAAFVWAYFSPKQKNDN